MKKIKTIISTIFIAAAIMSMPVFTTEAQAAVPTSGMVYPAQYSTNGEYMEVNAVYNTNNLPRRIYNVSHGGYKCSYMDMVYCKQIGSTGNYTILYKGKID